jgi:hypothetical protein
MFSFRQEFQGKMEEFENWMDQLHTGVGQVDEVTLAQVDSALQSVQALLQEHSEKQSAFNALYDVVKKLNCSSPEEASSVNESYSELVTKYQVYAKLYLSRHVYFIMLL